jgi:hypothetical protein
VKQIAVSQQCHADSVWKRLWSLPATRLFTGL